MNEVIWYAYCMFSWGMAFSLIQLVQLYGCFPNTAGSAEEVTGEKIQKSATLKSNTNVATGVTGYI